MVIGQMEAGAGNDSPTDSTADEESEKRTINRHSYEEAAGVSVASATASAGVPRHESVPSVPVDGTDDLGRDPGWNGSYQTPVTSGAVDETLTVVPGDEVPTRIDGSAAVVSEDADG